MRKHHLITLFFALGLVFVVAKAEAENAAKTEIEVQAVEGKASNAYRVTQARICFLMTAFDLNGITGNPAAESASKAETRKKPVLAAALSTAVPGAGEFYAGSWIKGAAFLAIEIAAWVGYKHYTDKGNRLRTEFRAYADDYWSEERWEERKDSNDPETHMLPETKTQQYYEMIGKYNQFMKGWKDWEPGGPNLTPRRDAYESMRHEHNDQLINASRCTMAALTNHLLSAMDAAWTVHKRNRSIRTALGMDARMAGAETVPCLSLRVAW